MKTLKTKLIKFDEKEFKSEWARRSVGMGMHYGEMHGARNYHSWIVGPGLKSLLSEIYKEKTETISQVLEKASLGDILVAGKLKWMVKEHFKKTKIAVPANEKTDFELWSTGIESYAIIPGLGILRRDK